MGADFIYSTIPAFEITPERLDRLRQLLAGAALDDFADSTATLADFEEDGMYADIREETAEGIDWLPKVAGSRETDLFHRHGMAYPVWLTGGLSCGDTVTEAMDFFDALNSWDSICRQMEEWALEDVAKEK